MEPHVPTTIHRHPKVKKKNKKKLYERDPRDLFDTCEIGAKLSIIDSPIYRNDGKSVQGKEGEGTGRRTFSRYFCVVFVAVPIILNKAEERDDGERNHIYTG